MLWFEDCLLCKELTTTKLIADMSNAGYFLSVLHIHHSEWDFHLECARLMFTFRIGIGISCEQACQDLHGDKKYASLVPAINLV